jgi:transcriptional regulator of arginine metabolism
VLRKLLVSAKVSTQEELAEELESQGYPVTQSTISRDLRRLGAIKVTEQGGRTGYRLFENAVPASSISVQNFKGLLLEIQHNGSMIVIHTSPGSASLVARRLDEAKPEGLLGTIAGDDTIFVAPASAKKIQATMDAIVEELR